MSTISASTTTTTAYVVTADTTGALVLQTGATPTTALTLSSAQLMTLPNDASISGLTVGKGGGATSTNTAVGASALNATNTIGDCTAFGYQALKLTTGKQNTAVGSNAGASMTSGEGLAAFGWNAANLNTADNVTALGHNTLGVNTTGANNTAVGNAALNVNTTGGSNTAVGRQALVANTTASNNTAVGYQALYSNTTGTQNTAIGREAGKNITTANYNCFVGDGAGTSTTGARNTFIGQGAGNAVTTGANNTIIGGYSGNGSPLGNTGSSFIVFADGNGNVKQFWHSDGYWEYVSNTQLRLPSTGGTGYIGYLADSSSIQISYNSTGNGVRLTSGATSWSTWSDQRLKNVTGTYTAPLADISQLQPIKFTWKSDEENKPQVGILAQSVQPVVPEAVEEGTISLEDETKYLTVRYTELIPLMVAAIQELKAELDTVKAELAALRG